MTSIVCEKLTTVAIVLVSVEESVNSLLTSSLKFPALVNFSWKTKEQEFLIHCMEPFLKSVFYFIFLFIHLFKQLVSRHNVNRTKNRTEESQARLFYFVLIS